MGKRSFDRRTVVFGAAGAVALAGAGYLGWRGATGSMVDYRTYTQTLRRAPDAGAPIETLVRYATLAANGHNTQPWRFAVEGNRIRVFADDSRRTPVVDPDDHHLYVSLGCAIENMAIAGRATGLPGTVEMSPGDGSAASFVFEQGTAADDPLFAPIRTRQSTRSLFDGRAIPPADLRVLEDAARETGVDLVLVTERGKIDAIGDLVVAGNDAQMADPAFLRELTRWIRFNPKSAMRSGDGLLSAAASGSPALPDALGPMALKLFMTAGTERERYARQIASTPALAILAGDRADPDYWIRVGRACQRMQLAATRLGIRHAFVNQPVEVAALRPSLARLAGMAGKRPDLLMRFGYAPALPYSPRRPVFDVIVEA